MTNETKTLLKDLVEDELTETIGTLLMYEHQLTMDPKYRRIPPENLEEEILRNLRLYKSQLQKALTEL